MADVERIVEPLVDAISTMVMSSVAPDGNIQDVLPCCAQISTSTLQLIQLGREACEGTTNRTLQFALIDSINNITAQIRGLITSFETLCQDTNNPNSKDSFTRAAKNMGDAINQLVDKSAEIIEDRMRTVANKAIDATKKLQSDARSGNKDLLIKSAKDEAQTNLDASQICEASIAKISDPARKRILRELVGAIKREGPQVITAAQGVFTSQPGAENTMNDRATQYINTLNKAADACRRDSSGAWKKLNQTMDYAKQLIDMARKFREANDRLTQALRSDDPTAYIKAARDAVDAAMKVVAAAEEVAKRTKDPVLKQMILDSCDDIRNLAGNLSRAADRAEANPNDPKTKQDIETSQKELADAVENLVYLTSGDGNLHDRLNQLGRTIDKYSDKVVDSALKRDEPRLKQNCDGLLSTADSYVDVSRQIAKQTSDPNSRKEVLDRADNVKQKAKDLVDWANKYLRDPSEANRKGMLAARDALKRALAGEQDDDFNFDLTDANELIRAAKAQAKIGLELAKEAEKMMNKMTDPAKKEELRKAIDKLREDCYNVISAAEHAAADPTNKDKFRKMLDAQKELAGSMDKVMTLTSGADRDLLDALRRMREAAMNAEGEALQEIFDLAEELIGDLQRFERSNADTHQTMQDVKSITGKSSVLATKMRKAASEHPAMMQDFKEVLRHAANCTKDKSMQLKIIGMVKIAAQGEEEDQTKSTAALLEGDVSEVVEGVSEELVKNRLTAVVRQLSSMRDAYDIWKGHHNLME